MVTAYILYGQGIGCHEECGHAYELAGAKVEPIHINDLLSGEKRLEPKQILNMSGGFLHGDILGAGMCAANEMEHAVIDGRRLKDILIEFADKGGIIYGQCNGFQVLVKTGLLPGIHNDYSKQTVTLTSNNCGNYRVAPVWHTMEQDHFAFDNVHDDFARMFLLWCRHGEGKLQFRTDGGSVPAAQADANRQHVLDRHVLMRYVTPEGSPTMQFPYNPNGSEDSIAGLVNQNGRIFGHMAHTEISVHKSRDPRWFEWKDQWRRKGIKAAELDERRLEGVCLQVFKNIVEYVRQA
jgi:phosphoribosylformylglycinamidine synthase